MSRIRGTAIVIALLATMVSALNIYPHQLAYFNEVSGGPASGHKHLLGSNLDWGQDLLMLAEWIRQHSVAPKDVNVISVGSRELVAILVGTTSTSVESAAWTLADATTVLSAESYLAEDVQAGSYQRIGYCIWAFGTGPLKPGQFKVEVQYGSSQVQRVASDSNSGSIGDLDGRGGRKLRQSADFGSRD